MLQGVSPSTGDSNYDAVTMKERYRLDTFAEGATSPHTLAPNLRLKPDQMEEIDTYCKIASFQIVNDRWR